MPALIQQIQDAYSAEPFQPFALHLQDGGIVPVARRHCLQFTETASKIVVTHPNGWVDTISAPDVLEIGAASGESIAAYAREHPVAKFEIPNRSKHRPLVYTQVTGAGKGVRWHYIAWTNPLKASLELFALAYFVLLLLTHWT